MENLDKRITPSDDNNILDNLGKMERRFVSTNDVHNDEEDSFGLPPDEALMLKEEAALKEKAELEKIAASEKVLNNHEESDIDEPSQGGGGIGTKAQMWLKKFKR